MPAATAIPDRLDRLTIVHYPDPVLRKRCREVTVFDERLAALAGRMLELMRAHNGVGLAAPQVGVPIRMFVFNASGEADGDGVCVNPTLHDGEGAEEMLEGCLSLPNVEVPIRRAVSVTLRGQDAAGAVFESAGAGLLARVWQHEVDHLNGRLIIDGMSEAERIANRKALKQLEAKTRR